MEKKGRIVIACGGMKAELEKQQPERYGVKMHYMPQNLHRTPEKLTLMLQKAIDEAAEEAKEIVLGYGLCSNGVVGLRAPRQGLYIPRVHDCITLYLGSREKYQKIFSEQPGTYYLTPNWIDNRKDPLGLAEHEYTRRVGPNAAFETMEWELKNYTHISFIDSIPEKRSTYREIARNNARRFGKRYIEIPGKETFFRKIIFGPWDDQNFVYVNPHEISKQKDFIK